MANFKGRQGYAWYVVIILFLAYTVSFVDRQILTLLVGPIKRDLGISDTQISLLIGLSFALFYTLMGLPIGRLVDSKNRTRIITVGILVWSVMTAGCGLAKHYWQLFLMRVGVGVGEAALSPAAFSIISDYFPARRLALANSIYNSGAYVGGAVAMIIGGMLVKKLDGIGTIALPVIGDIFSWQLIFIIVGLPGLLLVLLMKTVKEPERTGNIANRAEEVPLKELKAQIAPHKRTLPFLFLSFSMSAMVGYSITAWVPAFLIRVHHMPVDQVGLYFGSILILAGIGGVIAGGWYSDYLQAKGRADARMRTGLVAMGFSLLPVIFFPIVESPVVCLTLMGFAIMGLTFPMASGPTALQEIFPTQLRGQMSAVYMFVLNIVGMALGPTLVALMTDYVFMDELAVGKSLSVMCGSAVAIAIVLFGLGLKPYRQSVVHYQSVIAAN